MRKLLFSAGLLVAALNCAHADQARIGDVQRLVDWSDGLRYDVSVQGGHTLDRRKGWMGQTPDKKSCLLEMIRTDSHGETLGAHYDFGLGLASRPERRALPGLTGEDAGKSVIVSVGGIKLKDRRVIDQWSSGDTEYAFSADDQGFTVGYDGPWVYAATAQDRRLSRHAGYLKVLIGETGAPTRATFEDKTSGDSLDCVFDSLF